MEPTQELVDSLYRDKVRQARAMTPEQKLLAGPQLFDHVCRIMRDGIRHQHPGADERRVGEILRERLAIAARLENRNDK
jgi:hypothetical protein